LRSKFTESRTSSGFPSVSGLYINANALSYSDMPLLKDFVAALQAGWFPALVALCGCAIIIAGDWYKVPYLDDIPPLPISLAVIVGVFSFSILVANLVYVPVRVVEAVKRKRARQRFVERVQNEIFDAPNDELALLAYLVSSGKKAFPANFNDRRLVPLVSKGWIKRLPGSHSVLEWPHIVQDDVWEILVDHKDKLKIPNIESIADKGRARPGGRS